MSEFVNANPQDLKFDAIEREIENAVQSQLSTNDLGIRLEFLGFKRIGLPDSVSQAVFDRMKSERQLQISTTENTGKRDAQIIESTADRQAAETLANATATAIRIRAMAKPRPAARSTSSSRIPTWRFSCGGLIRSSSRSIKRRR